MSVSRFNSEGYYDPTAYKALTRVEKDMRKPLAYVASPFDGDEAKNNAIRYCRFALDSGVIPVAPRLFLASFMPEAADEDMRMAFLGKCDQLWVFGNCAVEDMAAEIAKAQRRKMPIRYFTDACREVKN